jgi:hypothetical protein
MDKTQDLILGVLGGTWVGPGQYPGVEAYLVSIARSGFTGRKVMLAWGIRPEVRQKLVEYDFEVIDLPQPGDPFFHARMRVCWEYLRDHKQEFRYVLWLDTKDLILQSDPSVWMEQNIDTKSIIASNECVTIEQEETNQLWARSILGEAKYQEIKDCEVINGGTWAGTAEAMTEVFHQTHLGCYTYGGPYPPCQININYVLHTMFKDDLSIPRWSEGFAACLHPCWSPWRTPCWTNKRDPHPVLDLETCTLHAGTVPDGKNPMVVFNPRWGTTEIVQIAAPSHPLQGVECVANPQGKAFAIVHGWDRDWDAKSLFEFRYRYDGDFDLEGFRKWNEEAVKSMPEPRRPLRRVKHEVPASGSQLPQPGRLFKRNP